MPVKKRCRRLARITVTACLSLFFALIPSCRSSHRTVLTLSIAASLQDAITEVEAGYQRDHGPIEFRNNFGSSGTLAREIEQGAPVDAIISAGERQIDELQAKRLLIATSRINLLKNSLVLIAPRDSKLTGFDGLTAPAIRLIAMGDPTTVPAGQYALQTLKALDLYHKLTHKLVLGKDVRQVLTYVETGNADAGLVYATDALISKEVRVVAVASESSHAPIVYPAAVVTGTHDEKAARAFLEYLQGAAARAIFVKHGFTMA